MFVHQKNVSSVHGTAALRRPRCLTGGPLLTESPDKVPSARVARTWLDCALAPYRVGSVTSRTTSFDTIIFVHLVLHVRSLRRCACLISILRVLVIKCLADVMDPPRHVFVRRPRSQQLLFWTYYVRALGQSALQSLCHLAFSLAPGFSVNTW